MIVYRPIVAGLLATLFLLLPLTAPRLQAISSLTSTDSQCSPAIDLTVSAYGDLNGVATGTVSCADPVAHKVAVFIYVGAGWWTKPYANQPMTSIQTNGTWTCDITTGGQDHLATQVAAFLIPNSYTPPLALGDADLPPVLRQNSLAWRVVQREPRTATPTLTATIAPTLTPTDTPTRTPTVTSSATSRPTASPSATPPVPPPATTPTTTLTLATPASVTPTPSPTACSPSFVLTQIPVIHSSANLRGQVTCAAPADYRIAVYIYGDSAWWTKPYANQPLTPIAADGTWETDITTGGNDLAATQIAVFLVRVAYAPPVLIGAANLPLELFQNAVYYLIVDRTTLPTPMATVSPTPTSTTPPPANDAFAAATLVELPARLTGNTRGATLESGEPGGCGNSHSVWFRIVPPTTGKLLISTANSQFDTVITLYRGTSLDNLTFLRCDDDSGPGYTSQLEALATVGETYYLRLAGFGSSSGEFALSITLEPTVLYLPYVHQQCRPLVLTAVPLYGAYDDLRGQARCVPPADFGIAVYIYVDQGWWIKPTADRRLTPLQPDGSWEVDITTGGRDEYASQIAVFLVPSRFTPPLVLGEPTLPAELYARAYTYDTVNRDRRIAFSGYTWRVKSSLSPVGPGPNRFSSRDEDVWVDVNGRLHMRLAYHDGVWYSSEVVSEDVLGYGRYIFRLDNRVDRLDKNVVVGLFTWDDQAPAAHNRELDIEFSRWGEDYAPNAQFVVQPWDQAGNRHRFYLSQQSDQSLHQFEWRPGSVTFTSAQGHIYPPTPDQVIEGWLYTGTSVPQAGRGNVRINLWLLDGQPPTDGQTVELVIRSFDYLP